MAGHASKKTQADLIELVKAAGWKEDQKSTREWRWFHSKFHDLRPADGCRQPGSEPRSSALRVCLYHRSEPARQRPPGQSPA